MVLRNLYSLKSVLHEVEEPRFNQVLYFGVIFLVLDVIMFMVSLFTLGMLLVPYGWTLGVVGAMFCPFKRLLFSTFSYRSSANISINSIATLWPICLHLISVWRISWCGVDGPNFHKVAGGGRGV